jgi:hypothetical protein
MTDEITFMDLAALLKITPNTPLEKLGSALNASIFDASNLAGTLKQKDLISFTTNYPGPNSITITEAGQNLLKEADTKSTMPIDALDESLLVQLSGGKRLPIELQHTLNIRSRDLAMRLYKLNKQNLIIYELKNGGAELLLTEEGFLHAKGGGAVRQPSTPTQPTMQSQGQQPAIQAGTPGQTPPKPQQMPGMAMPPAQAAKPDAEVFHPGLMPGVHAEKGRMGQLLPMIIVAVILVIVVIFLLIYRHIL